MTLLITALLGCGASQPAEAKSTVEVGAPAPDFTLSDLDGKKVTLSSLKGNVVVLEWFNPGCPFVVSAHEGGPLATMAADLGGKVEWLAINSGAAGKQGHGVDVNKAAVGKWKLDHPVLLDEDGTVGKTYGATNTPQMVVIDKDGKVAYWGALDNAPRGQHNGKHVAFTKNAIDAVLAGEQVKPDRTQPWGCSVKY